MDLKFDGIGFNGSFFKGRFIKKEELIAYCNDNPHWFENEKNREKKLGQLFDIIQKMGSTTEATEVPKIDPDIRAAEPEQAKQILQEDKK